MIRIKGTPACQTSRLPKRGHPACRCLPHKSLVVSSRLRSVFRDRLNRGSLTILRSCLETLRVLDQTIEYQANKRQTAPTLSAETHENTRDDFTAAEWVGRFGSASVCTPKPFVIRWHGVCTLSNVHEEGGFADVDRKIHSVLMAACKPYSISHI